MEFVGSFIGVDFSLEDPSVPERENSFRGNPANHPQASLKLKRLDSKDSWRSQCLKALLRKRRASIATRSHMDTIITSSERFLVSQASTNLINDLVKQIERRAEDLSRRTEAVHPNNPPYDDLWVRSGKLTSRLYRLDGFVRLMQGNAHHALSGRGVVFPMYKANG